MNRRHGGRVVLTTVLLGAGLLAILLQHSARGATVEVREGGIFRISLGSLDYVDPALAYPFTSWSLIDTTCARLMTYPDKPPPEGYRVVPEVAAAYPSVSRDGRTWTFTLRSGFRFSDGTPVRASAFARAIARTLAPGVDSPAAATTRGRSLAPRTFRPDGRRPWRASSPAATGSSSASRDRCPTSRRRRRCRSSAPCRRRFRPTPKASAPSPGPARTTWPSTAPVNGW